MFAMVALAHTCIASYNYNFFYYNIVLFSVVPVLCIKLTGLIYLLVASIYP